LNSYAIKTFTIALTYIVITFISNIILTFDDFYIVISEKELGGLSKYRVLPLKVQSAPPQSTEGGSFYLVQVMTYSAGILGISMLNMT
jgi:hypothetical protein